MAEPAATPASTSSDWPAEAAETIERVVGTVRDATTGKAITVAKALVYGTFAAIVGLAVAVMAAVALVRLAVVYQPEILPGDDRAWPAHGLVGLLFSVFGLLMWRKRSRRGDAEYPTGV
jgi:hypothetical protein